MTTMNENNDLLSTALQLSALFRDQMENALAPLRDQIAQVNEAYIALETAFERQRQENTRLQNERDDLADQVYTLRRRFHEVTDISVIIRPFTGEINTWNQFLESILQQIQCHPKWFNNDRKKVLYLLDFMRGKAEIWAKMISETARSSRPAPELDNFQLMVAKATLGWGVIGLEYNITNKLMMLEMQGMGDKEMREYNTVFGDLAERINWSDVIILQKYLLGLPTTVQNRLKGYHGDGSLSTTMAYVSSVIDTLGNQT
jgi:hypothetical protein